MISVLKNGPPAVIVCMRSNARKQSSMVSTEMMSRNGQQHRQGDVPEDADAAGAVDAGGLVQVPRDRLQRGEPVDHRDAEELPDVDHGGRVQRRVGVRPAGRPAGAPNRRRTAATGPAPGSKMNRMTTPTIAVVVTTGMK